MECGYPRLIYMMRDDRIAYVDPIDRVKGLFVNCPLTKDRVGILECARCEYNGGGTCSQSRVMIVCNFPREIKSKRLKLVLGADPQNE